MRVKPAFILGAVICAFYSAAALRSAFAQDPEAPIVRLAELEIDPLQTDLYKALLKEEIEASIRAEPGVLTLYAVSIRDHPTQIRLFEMYRDQAAYLSHLKTTHFLKYKTQTQGMVKSLTLLETDPILLGSKFK